MDEMMEVDLIDDSHHDEALLNDENEDMSVEGSEVEDILEDFDSEGNPKEKCENEQQVPKLPPEFSVQQRYHRFRKPYEATALTVRELFRPGGGMTKSLGKLDAEKRILLKVQRVLDHTRDGSRASHNPDFVDPKLDPLTFVLSELKKWISEPLFAGFSEAFPNDPVLERLKQTYTVFSSFGANLEEESRIKYFMDFVMRTLRRTVDCYLQTMLDAIELKHTLDDWVFQFQIKIVEKNTAIDYWRLYKKCLIAKPSDFDESSNRGLKPLRNSLFSPYFKDWFGHIAAPSMFNKTMTTNLLVMIMSMKKKWTVKDMSELQSSILKTVQERQLVEAKNLSDIMCNFLQVLDQSQQKGSDSILQEINNVEVRTWEHVKKTCFRIGRGKARKPEKSKKPMKARTKIDVYPQNPSQYEDLPFALRCCKNTSDIRNWLEKENKRINKLKYDQVFTEHFTSFNVDWDVVSAELMSRTKKLRVAEDCRNCFEHSGNPVYENKRKWSEREKAILKTQGLSGEEWHAISAQLPKPRPEFVVFYKWQKLFNKTKKMTWTSEMDSLVREKVRNSTWDALAVEVGNFAATKKQVQERFKKSLNPVLRFGKFTRVEDSLMLLTLEKLKAHFGRERHFGIMTAYLPWRYESAWRDRAENLFADYIVPWTLEEDEKLLKLAVSMNRDWSRISKTFDSFKTRKSCLTRHKILEKRLRDGVTLDMYHHSYAMIRYNVREYGHLRDISNLLKEIIKGKVPECFLRSVHNLPRDRPPTEDELQNLILSFDRIIMAATVKMIDAYLEKRDEFWTDWRLKVGMEPGQKRKTHDRRTFHPENTQSIASALHIRDVKLIPEQSLKIKLTQREAEIYKFHAQFSSTKPLKKDKPRPYIPSADVLVRLPEVKRIVLKARRNRKK